MITHKIRIFNPHRLSDDDLERSFIARQDTFRSLLNDIVSTGQRSVPQHHILIGQRGMGKTTLLRRLALELHREPHDTRFLPLTFPEEQYIEVDRLAKFWLNCLDSTANTLEREGDTTTVSQIDHTVQQLARLKTDDETLQEECRDALRSVWQDIGRRPVLFIDNFNLLLSRMRAHDYALRGFFSKPGAAILIGASAVYPAELNDYSAAFYDGFKSHYLYPLELDDIRDIIIRLARASNREDLVNRIHHATPRLAALRDLTGGNPRTAVLLFELFANGFSEDAYEDLDALLDIVTPLYQSRLDQLPDLGQTIVGTLARNWSPMTKIAIVEAARVNDSSVSPQLGRLRDIGLVEATAVFPEKKTGYQIAERFFNIWYLMRFTTRRQRAGLVGLARFLQEFHTPDEQARSARELMSRSSLSRGNITYAMALASAIGSESAVARELELKAQLELIELMQGVRKRIATILDPDELDPHVFSFAELKQRLVDAVPEGSAVSGQEFAERVLGSPAMVSGGIAGDSQLNRETIAASNLSPVDIKKLVEELDVEELQLAKRFSLKAVQWIQMRLHTGILTSWRHNEELSTLVLRAESLEQMKLVREFGHPTAKRHLSDQAFQHLVKVLVLEPSDQGVSWEWDAWGTDLAEEFGRYDEAEQAYRKAIEINPNFAYPWDNLGDLLQYHLGRYDEAEQAYRKAIEIDPNYVWPWNGLSNLLRDYLGHYDEAEQAYRKAIEIDPNNARLWNSLGNLLQDHLGRYDIAELAYRTALELDLEFDAPRLNLAFLLRDIRYDTVQAKAILADLRDHDEWQDTLALHEALFAAYDDNWGLTAEALVRALKAVGDRLPPYTREDWFRASAVLLHLGFGEKLVDFLKAQHADVTLLPWFAAVHAHTVGDRRDLVNIPQEARSAAEAIFDEIDKRRQQLPKDTQRGI
ncbi:tetratricopeptide repeat protein [Candidatus Entotheonella palauensis]|uniref:ORC1/DEAH AAA+ ATPase domain-containing protein n=1 Tax=Candidatus Entotheonella gemina TaxID=1429439 RepID=W4MFV7_9BACT|nr:tetratricopeptide repeat protein [Candidatus Entotheonella palauensis]ETX09093.1 MAG: hypothetical protein ETSY2_01520 [Candidatus Entotheonella gemina]